MAVLNVHQRRLAVSPDEAGSLIDSLAGPDDRLWPHHAWPPMRFDRPLAVGAVGGHGPIRYVVSHYVPGQWIRFRFTGPRGFDGFHELTVSTQDDGTLLRHTLSMRLHGWARLSWPLVFRPLHDALIEDGLDRAGVVGRPARWSPYVRLLRGLAAGGAVTAGSRSGRPRRA
jgi:hypothetical protein